MVQFFQLQFETFDLKNSCYTTEFPASSIATTSRDHQLNDLTGCFLVRVPAGQKFSTSKKDNCSSTLVLNCWKEQKRQQPFLLSIILFLSQELPNTKTDFDVIFFLSLNLQMHMRAGFFVCTAKHCEQDRQNTLLLHLSVITCHAIKIIGKQRSVFT